MKSYHYNAVVYGGDVYCVECLPDDVDVHGDDVDPIFADSEWEYVPVCEKCGVEHDYVTIIKEEKAKVFSVWSSNGVECFGIQPLEDCVIVRINDAAFPINATEVSDMIKFLKRWLESEARCRDCGILLPAGGDWPLCEPCDLKRATR